MNVRITGASALRVWLAHPDPEPILQARTSCDLEDCPQSASELESLHLDDGRFGPGPVHLMVSRASDRKLKHRFRYTVFNGVLPYGSFCQVSDHIRIASPELCTAHFASVDTFARLMELCMMLCGYYVFDSNEQGGVKERAYPLCTLKSLFAFCANARTFPGVGKVLAALKHVRDRSRSPMETRLYLFMCLPSRLGGYGLPKAELNHAIEISHRARLYTNRSALECDLCWPDFKVVVEYDGHDYHESQRDRARDATKQNELLAQGYAIFRITKDQICNKRSLEKVVYDIAKKLGYRLRIRSEKWPCLHGRLRQQLFRSMHACDSTNIGYRDQELLVTK